MNQVILVTGASSGFGRLMANALAAAGHTVYASMRDLDGKNAAQVAEVAGYARDNGVDLRTVELDVQSGESAQRAIDTIVDAHGRLDVLIHNAGHMVWGPSEAFTPEDLAHLYDVNVLGAQRVNRAALPHLRAARRGLVVWIGSSSAAGGVPPLLGPYFAAKAAMDALAVCYARELAPFGIETSIVVPGAFTKGTNHFARAGAPSDTVRANDYEADLPHGFADRMLDALGKTVPDDADPQGVADAVVSIVDAPYGKRPFRVVIDPASDGAAVSYAVIDRVRAEFLHRIGFADLMTPAMGSRS
ncbi:NAD(P)-dependent dehydrogenase, short-chain alcohol dehydrogenase family [Luteibacter sp. UNCMF331Sha3.1]|uniref:SDR family oxidoreductase n=1 Tax=Luteibacter sp. UNCMF331Sha3.1 TaxID=1502760 RepID=UPI0008B0B196|nr:SDR family oxidoreductase [Luteibacter sp. UNCMF331Sha3.1]SEN15697.1 NAD(P)-dependent dehydrogenase, short-chain alcohol dehydrogenase family [Luteibacter sp. UNCMF331Sha3.1]